MNPVIHMAYANLLMLESPSERTRQFGANPSSVEAVTMTSNILPFQSLEEKLWHELNAARDQMASEMPFVSDETLIRFMAARRDFLAEYMKGGGGES